jgi:hypothetical protein
MKDDRNNSIHLHTAHYAMKQPRHAIWVTTGATPVQKKAFRMAYYAFYLSDFTDKSLVVLSANSVDINLSAKSDHSERRSADSRPAVTKCIYHDVPGDHIYKFAASPC